MGSGATWSPDHWMALWEHKNRQTVVTETAKETGTPCQVAPGRLDQISPNPLPRTLSCLLSRLDFLSAQGTSACRGYDHFNHRHHRPEMALKVEHSVLNPLQVTVSAVGACGTGVLCSGAAKPTAGRRSLASGTAGLMGVSFHLQGELSMGRGERNELPDIEPLTSTEHFTCCVPNIQEILNK